MQNHNSLPLDLRVPCNNCTNQATIAYWDEELEWYLYRKTPLNCNNCSKEIKYVHSTEVYH